MKPNLVMNLGALLIGLCGSLSSASADTPNVFSGQWRTSIRTATSTCGSAEGASVGPLAISVQGDSVSVRIDGGETLTGRLFDAHSFAVGAFEGSGDQVALVSLSLVERKGRANLKVVLTYRDGDVFCGYTLAGTAVKTK